jgi:hypothetical protein
MNTALLAPKTAALRRPRTRKRQHIQEGFSPKPARFAMPPAYCGTTSPEPKTQTSKKALQK